MKALINIIRWITGLFFSLISLGGIASGDTILGFLMLSFGLLLIPPIGKKVFGKLKENKTSKKSFTEGLTSTYSKHVSKINHKISDDLNKENQVEIFLKKQQNEKEQNIKNFKYQPFQIQRKGIQLLESLNILHTTKNIDTLKSRYKFIKSIYNEFINSSSNKRYISDIQIAVDEYKTLYYDKTINDFELQLLVKPNKKNLIEYYSECLYNCFNLFIIEQEYQISNLKRESAKSRRKEKIINVANEIITEYDNASTKEKFRIYIMNIQEKINSIKQP